MNTTDLYRIILFYDSRELSIQDIDNELFTEDREQYHFFLFHNRDLHFSKEIIKEQVLSQWFAAIRPHYSFKKDTVEMKKILTGFDKEEFEKTVDRAFKEYHSRIHYRIECILQTYTLFSDLYKEKSLIFVFPLAIVEFFDEYIAGKNINRETVSLQDERIKKFDIPYWLSYYTRENRDDGSETSINEDTLRILSLITFPTSIH